MSTSLSEALPTAYEFGRVIGRFLRAVGDGEDVDSVPEAVPAKGTVTFTPITTSRILIDSSSEPSPLITHEAITCTLDAYGHISRNGVRGVWLWTGEWNVAFNVSGISRTQFPILVTNAHTDVAPLDLWEAVPYTPPAGATVTTMLVPSNPTDGYVLKWSAASSSLVWGASSGTAAESVDWSDVTNPPATYTPTAHKASHATGGTDTLTPADIGAQPAGSYAPASHTQGSSTITDLTEAVQDVVGAMVAAAGGTYDDAAGTITLPSGGGGTVTTEQIIAAVGVVNGTNATSAQVAAWDAAGIIVLSTSPVINDTTDPTWSATLSVTDPDTDAATIVATALASDDIAVTGYERKIDAGAWAPITPSGLNFDITGLTLGTEYTVQLRAHDAAGNYSTPLSVTFTTAQARAPITDTFNRADSVTTLGSTDTGQAWQTVYGTAGISGNQARAYTNSARSVIDLGAANMSVAVDLTTSAPYIGLVVRWADANNYIFADTQTEDSFRLYKVIAGVQSAVGGYILSGLAVPRRIALEAFDDGTGTTVRRYINGALVATDFIGDANRPHGTKGGLTLGANSQTARFDNFEIKEITA